MHLYVLCTLQIDALSVHLYVLNCLQHTVQVPTLQTVHMMLILNENGRWYGSLVCSETEYYSESDANVSIIIY